MDQTKYFGKVYTPSDIVQRMLNTVFMESLEDVRICDPACGSGDFLVPVAEEVCRRLRKAPNDAQPLYLSTLRQLTGFDIDAKATHDCRERLSKTVHCILGEDYPHDFWRISVVDALDAWKLYENSFDWVIGNPPYVRIQHLESERRDKIYAADWSYFQGSSDLYIVFYELGLRLLKDEGNLLFISPSGWIRNQAGAFMRSDLTANHGIVSLWDFRDHQVFQGVSTYTCIAHIRKNGCGIPTKTYQWNDGNFSNSCDLIKLDERWAIVHKNTARSYSDPSLKLGDIADIRVGIQTLADKVFIAPVMQWKSENVIVTLNDEPRPIEIGAVRRIVKASVLKDGKDKMERVAIYPYSESGKLLPEKELAEIFPLAYSWLSENKDSLLGRDKGTFNPMKWYGYGREVSIRSALGPKILTSAMNPEPNFQICNDPDTLFYSGYCVKPKIDISLEDLIHELNSPEMDQHIRMFAQPFRGGWFSYAKRYIQDFPISTRIYAKDG
ncbi:MAG: Eco57I restriction-modification methylase domain-containing protein [Bacteroidetes bacterium]|nr:Eco57I restriction-modification methylase domain-containing protein [Bacteroidota bacterium]